MFLEPGFKGQRSGWIEVICGSMFSGKTELLINKYNTCKEQVDEENIIAFNYYKDTRYGNNKIISHNSNQIPSINIITLSEIYHDKNFSKR